ncbi:hypothetical protein [uncultured Jannaschia sp.]|uniref:hypothetical protein n=1 Tax=uncultured Jannaschia sp. TaxID=293347 RepID=UPI0026191BDF|nr:hypothetical protein [uncultured Jannaschia sp.]
MGEGLYWSRDGRTAYAKPYDDDLDPEDVDLWTWAYDDLVATIRASLSAAWWPVEREWRERSSRIVARNGLHEVWLTGDSYNRVHVTFGVRQNLDETDALARHGVDDRAEAFFDRLQETCDLHVRTSAWTSAPREMRRVAA